MRLIDVGDWRRAWIGSGLEGILKRGIWIDVDFILDCVRE